MGERERGRDTHLDVEGETGKEREAGRHTHSNAQTHGYKNTHTHTHTQVHYLENGENMGLNTIKGLTTIINKIVDVICGEDTVDFDVQVFYLISVLHTGTCCVVYFSHSIKHRFCPSMCQKADI